MKTADFCLQMCKKSLFTVQDDLKKLSCSNQTLVLRRFEQKPRVNWFGNCVNSKKVILYFIIIFISLVP